MDMGQATNWLQRHENLDIQAYYLPAAVAAHLLSAVIWVGGMFFAYTSLRPAAAKLLEVQQRTKLWRKCLITFFTWVWISIIVLPVTGYWIIYAHYGGMARVGWHIHVMQVIGIIMVMIFLHAFFAPFRQLLKALKHENFQTAADQLAKIRRFMGINLVLGIVVLVVAGGMRYLAI